MGSSEDLAGWSRCATSEAGDRKGHGESKYVEYHSCPGGVKNLQGESLKFQWWTEPA